MYPRSCLFRPPYTGCASTHKHVENNERNKTNNNNSSVVGKPVRARSSPPALGDTTPLAKAVQPRGDCMVELGSTIQKLIEAMRPPQRCINNNMRDLLSLIAKLHSSAHEEHIANKKARRSILVMPTTAETMPKSFKRKRKGLKKAIKKGKSCCFKEFCEKIDENPLGKAYKLMMAKNRGGKGQTPTCPTQLKTHVETLFLA